MAGKSLDDLMASPKALYPSPPTARKSFVATIYV
jgi:hypothetical protein